VADTVAVVFTPSGLRGEFPVGTPLLEAARKLGVDIDSVCGGRGLCGRCQIICTEGQFPKHGIDSRARHLSPLSETEQKYAARKQTLAAGRRLSCHTLIEGPLVIDVPQESQVHRQVVRKDPEVRDIELDPDIHLYYLVIPPDTMESGASELSRVLDALASDWQLTQLSVDSTILSTLPACLNEGDRAITAAVYSAGNDRKLIAVWPSLLDTVYGIAVDVGSTTIALHLTNLQSGDVVASTGCMNPQIRFGEDLMSRVSYVLMHPEGAGEMTVAVRSAINDLIAEAASSAAIRLDHIVSMAIAGNTIMHHLLLGIDPTPLGSAPFTLAVDDAISLPAREIDLRINPGGRAYIPPCIAGHVGADAAAVVLAEQPYRQQRTSLIIDIGTNAEIVLGNEERLLACSSPTGPAFEGAQISCGQRAAPGAIERVRIDRDSLAVRYKVIGADCWSDEAGFAEAIAGFGVTGICGSGIVEVIAEMYLSGILSEDGVIRASMRKKTDRVIEDGRTSAFLLAEAPSRITVTQNDVRQIQLAKAALYAGVRLLMDHFPTDRVDEIKIAGAFGSNIDVKYAMVLGLIPDCDLDRVGSIGNAASTGARIALLNAEAKRELAGVVKRIEKIETAVEKQFQEYFVDAMAIPHKTAPFTNLFSVVERPPVVSADEASQDETGRNRRRRRK
jgi:uncharacterized 2Fe-2S/4Fe-4S cluster protein (DUF4445 family)